MRRSPGFLSLRRRIFLALLALQILPLLAVALTTWVLRDQPARTRHRAESTLQDALSALNRSAAIPFEQRLTQLDEVARNHLVRIRVLDANRILYATQNYHRHTNLSQILTDLFDTRIADELKTLDACLPPAWQRPEVAASLATGAYNECVIRNIGEPPLPLIGHCTAARRYDTPLGAVVIVVEDPYRRVCARPPTY